MCLRPHGFTKRGAHNPFPSLSEDSTALPRQLNGRTIQLVASSPFQHHPITDTTVSPSVTTSGSALRPVYSLAALCSAPVTTASVLPTIPPSLAIPTYLIQCKAPTCSHRNKDIDSVDDSSGNGNNNFYMCRLQIFSCRSLAEDSQNLDPLVDIMLHLEQDPGHVAGALQQ